MMPNFVLILILAFLAGVGLGCAYFAGLWLTVRRVHRARRPLAVLLGSFVVRAAALLVGLYFVMGGRWQRLLAALAGFLAARFVMVYALGVAERDDSSETRRRVETPEAEAKAVEAASAADTSTRQ